MDNFTPISALIGGFLIGAAAVALLYFNQKICGISGIYTRILPPIAKGSEWNGFFVLGLLTGGLLLLFLSPRAFNYTIDTPLPWVALGGFLVGFGSRMGNGCTSGHGVCGIGRLSGRSLLAAAIFFLTALATATLFHGVRG